MPPSVSSLCTRRLERFGTWFLKMGEPKVVHTPSTSVRSLIGTGSPARSPRASTGRSSSRRACALARSKHSVGKALTAGSTSLILASSTSRRSSGVMACAFRRSTRETADALIRSSIAGSPQGLDQHVRHLGEHCNEGESDQAGEQEGQRAYGYAFQRQSRNVGRNIQIDAYRRGDEANGQVHHNKHTEPDKIPAKLACHGKKD